MTSDVDEQPPGSEPVGDVTGDVTEDVTGGAGDPLSSGESGAAVSPGESGASLGSGDGGDAVGTGAATASGTSVALQPVVQPDSAPADALGSGESGRLLTGPDHTASVVLHFEDRPGARREPEPLVMRLKAAPRELSEIRRAMRSWLADAGVAAGAAEDMVLACGEAAANVIEHAYGGRGDGWMEVTLSISNGMLVASVGDRGRWHAQGSTDGRGHGIRLIGALMDQVDLHSDEAGTKVTMRKTLAEQGRTAPSR